MISFPLNNRIELELSSHCTIECPSCPRVELADSEIEWNHGNIDTDDVIAFLNNNSLNAIIICGSFGDSIYHPDIPLIIEKCVESLTAAGSVGGTLTIDTNGSYVKQEKWQEISRAMNKVTDNNFSRQFVFSIDGTPENFHTYRVNGDWKSISMGMEIMTHPVPRNYKVTWKYIVFKYNSSFDHLKLAYDTAISLGIDSFTLIHTCRGPKEMIIATSEFEENLALLEEYKYSLDMQSENSRQLPELHIAIKRTKGVRLSSSGSSVLPMYVEQVIVGKKGKKDTIKVSKNDKVTKQITFNNSKSLTAEPKPSQLFETPHIVPQCMNDKSWTSFVGSDGTYWPCCFVRSHCARTIKELNLTESDMKSMNIKDHTLEEIVSGPGYDKLMNGFDIISTCHIHCKKPDKSKIGLSTV